MRLLPHYQKAKDELDASVERSNIVVLTLCVAHSREEEDRSVESFCLGVDVDSVEADGEGGSLRVATPDNGLQRLSLQEVLAWMPDFDVCAATDSYIILRRLKT